MRTERKMLLPHFGCQSYESAMQDDDILVHPKTSAALSHGYYKSNQTALLAECEDRPSMPVACELVHIKDS